MQPAALGVFLEPAQPAQTMAPPSDILVASPVLGPGSTLSKVAGVVAQHSQQCVVVWCSCAMWRSTQRQTVRSRTRGRQATLAAACPGSWRTPTPFTLHECAAGRSPAKTHHHASERDCCMRPASIFSSHPCGTFSVQAAVHADACISSCLDVLCLTRGLHSYAAGAHRKVWAGCRVSAHQQQVWACALVAVDALPARDRVAGCVFEGEVPEPHPFRVCLPASWGVCISQEEVPQIVFRNAGMCCRSEGACCVYGTHQC